MPNFRIATMTNASTITAKSHANTLMRYVKVTVMLSAVILLLNFLMLTPKPNFFKSETEKIKPLADRGKSLKSYCVCNTTKCVMGGNWRLRPNISESDRLEVENLHVTFSPKKHLTYEENLRKDEFCGAFYDVNR